jgi:hypothetical protein
MLGNAPFTTRLQLFEYSELKRRLGKYCQKQFQGLSEQYAVLQTCCEGSYSLMLSMLSLTT